LRLPAAGAPRARLLLLHGLSGSVTSRCLLRTLPCAAARGFETLRVNARGAGEGIYHSRRLPHAGRTADLGEVIARAPWSAAAAGTPLFAVGFSLGGAILLRYLAERGEASGLDGAVAVNPPTDLALCLDRLEQGRNRLYHSYYTVALRRALARRARLYPERYAPPTLRRHRSVRSIDEDYVAPDAGFASAADYYAGCSAGPLLERIRTPVFILSSRDDPFVPAPMVEEAAARIPGASLVLAEQGGHLGYLARSGSGLTFWAGEAAVTAAEACLEPREASGPSWSRPVR
jgi:predicted alpha/beta-fold hydrolase